MIKTAGLVVVAIILGVVMLNIIDDGSSKPGSPIARPTTTTVAKTTTTTRGAHSTTTTRPAGPVRTPAQLRIVVLNAGSGVSGFASTMTSTLASKGYVNHGTAGNTSARSGRAVACRAGLSREAAALATAVGGKAAVIAFPDTPPAGVDKTVDCIVLLGKTS